MRCGVLVHSVPMTVAKIGHNANRLVHKHFVREWRQHRGLNLETLANRVADALGGTGFDHSQLSKIERHSTKLTEQKLYAIADCLNVEPGLLFVHPDVAAKRHKLATIADGKSDEQVDAIVQAIKALSIAV